MAEEDRVMNALLVIFEYADKNIINAFLRFIGAPINNRDTPSFSEHIPYSPENIIDGEIFIEDKLLVAIEVKIQKNQLTTSDQPSRYFKLLEKKNLPRKLLLLLSPDNVPPKEIEQIPSQNKDCFIVWRSWRQLWGFLKQQSELLEQNDVLSLFLINQYLEYLNQLGLKPSNTSSLEREQELEPKLHFLLGNVAVEKILLHLYHHGGGHMSGFARDHSLGRGNVQRVLKRLVDSGLVKKEARGRVIWYSFDIGSPLLKPILELIRVIYDAIPEDEKKNIFQPQYRPDNL